jgi:RNA polymerase sigma factor (TIGR02999 family)
VDNVTQLLSAIDQGDPQAANELLPLVYDELRRLAAAQMAREKPGQTLDPTALVHEAYLRLVGEKQFANRRHFFVAAAEAMRRIRVENARRKGRIKHGGGRHRTDADLDSLMQAGPDEELLALRRPDLGAGGRVSQHLPFHGRPCLALRSRLALYRHGRRPFRKKMTPV